MKFNLYKRGIMISALALILIFGSGFGASSAVLAQHAGGGGHFGGGGGHFGGGGGHFGGGGRAGRGGNVGGRGSMDGHAFDRGGRGDHGDHDRDHHRDHDRFFGFGFGDPFFYDYPYYYDAYPYYYGDYWYVDPGEKGYHDGLNRGKQDARDGRSYDPNNSSHYRNGSPDYRTGFEQGYEVGYGQH